mmetsp:Transcript_6560/g.14119  ORF Transcript_6560/g.14119 Transcript_6560/m.14119 type:complete len:191 (+) Transcript_6560:361-933(+)
MMISEDRDASNHRSSVATTHPCHRRKRKRKPNHRIHRVSERRGKKAVAGGSRPTRRETTDDRSINLRPKATDCSSTVAVAWIETAWRDDARENPTEKRHEDTARRRRRCGKLQNREEEARPASGAGKKPPPEIGVRRTTTPNTPPRGFESESILPEGLIDSLTNRSVSIGRLAINKKPAMGLVLCCFPYK